MRHALIALIVAVPLAFASEVQKPPCEPIDIDKLQIQTKSEEWIHVVKVYMPVNIFKARAEARAAIHNKTVITKALAAPAVKPKAKPVKKAVKKKRSVCGNKQQVWRTLANGHRKYRCK